MIHHRKHRQGDPDAIPTVLLNGLMMTIPSWLPFTEFLETSGDLHGCDFRGQLLTPEPPHPSFAGNARDVADLIDALGVERAHLVGTSLGAAVAIMTAARFPDRVASVAALTAGDHPDPDLLEIEAEWRESCEAVIGGGNPRRFVGQLFGAVYTPQFVRENRALLDARLDAVAAMPTLWFENLIGLMAAVRVFDLRPELGQVTCPTLVVAADDDRIIPLARTRALADGIGGARFEVVAGCGHGAIFEKPAEIGRLVSEFLREIGG